MEGLRNFAAEQSENPQVSEPNDDNQHEKFFKEVEMLGEEQIRELEKKMSMFDELQKKLEALTQ